MPASPHLFPRRPPSALPRRLAFARLRTAHDVTLRELVHTSWDADAAQPLRLPPSGASWRGALRRPQTLPPRAATDVSGAALTAARAAESLAERAARDAADAAQAARDAIHAAEKAAAYAASFAANDNSVSLRSLDLPRFPLHKAPAEASLPDPPEPPSPPSPPELRPPRSSATFKRQRLNGPAEQCADIVDDPDAVRVNSLDLDAELVHSMSGHSVNGPPSSPSLTLPTPVPVPLGKVWSLDVVATWHNAVRLELADLFLILDCVSAPRPAAPVTRAELRALFAWFSTFEAFLVTGLKAEEEVLFPWLEQWGRIDGELSTASRTVCKGAIIRGIRDTAACAALLGLDRDLPPGMLLTNPDRRYYDGFKVGYAELAPNLGSVTEGAVCGGILRKVTDAVASFSTQLLNYFHEQERSLPVIIESLYDPEDMYSASIERRIMRAIWKCGRKDESMVMLLRAVEDSPSCKQWTCRNLRRLERVAMPLWRRRYNNARGAVIAKFKQRKQSWERSAASTDMAFGSSLHRLNLGSATARSRMGPMPGIQSHLAEPRSYGSSSSTDNKFPTGHETEKLDDSS